MVVHRLHGAGRKQGNLGRCSLQPRSNHDRPSPVALEEQATKKKKLVSAKRTSNGDQEHKSSEQWGGLRPDCLKFRKNTLTAFGLTPRSARCCQEDRTWTIQIAPSSMLSFSFYPFSFSITSQWQRTWQEFRSTVSPAP